MNTEQQTFVAQLRANRERRVNVAVEANAAKQELHELLLKGYAARLEVAEMARNAQISRDTAHRILKEAGVLSWREKRDWASQVLMHIPKGGYERNKFRMFVNMLLLKALGSNPEDVPQSVEGVLAAATEAMRTTAGHPDFEPEFDRAVLHLAWPA